MNKSESELVKDLVTRQYHLNTLNDDILSQLNKLMAVKQELIVSYRDLAEKLIEKIQKPKIIK